MVPPPRGLLLKNLRNVWVCGQPCKANSKKGYNFVERQVYSQVSLEIADHSTTNRRPYPRTPAAATDIIDAR
jgi:hypothetical protein